MKNNAIVIELRISPVTSESCRQYAVPSVFGMISDRNNTANVKITDAIVRYSLPNWFWTSEPTPAAPIVCAMVFSVRMAVRGFTASSDFNFAHNMPLRLPSFSHTATCVFGMESTTASSIEQRNDTPSARTV